MKRSLSLAFLLYAILNLPAQTQAIHFSNSSFEGTPHLSIVPDRWHNCGFEDETPPDILPVPPVGDFNVAKTAKDGQTFLGMVVRDNGTWESISQSLRQPMTKGQCYKLNFYAARSPIYNSLSRKTGEIVNYETPVILCFYGGFGPCDHRELLAETDLIINKGWILYELSIVPNDSYNSFIIEAHYDPSRSDWYNGNVLLDGLYPLKTCDSTVKSPAKTEFSERITLPSDTEIPTIDFELTSTLEELSELIERHGPEISFSADKEELERRWYFTNQKPDKPYYQNLSLHQIVEGLKQFQRVQLIIGVNGHSLESTRKRMEKLGQALNELHLSKNQYKILDFTSRKARRRKWLWNQQNIPLYMQLVLR
jgi:hypothetical protein